MSDQTWGLMPKSQIDATLIEERMTEMITEHNDDPTAHMADAQSIGLHRVNDILDHKAGSVLADKETMSELSITENFSTLEHWGEIGDVTLDNWPDCTLYLEYGVTNSSYLYLNPQSPTPFLDYLYAGQFQVIFRTDLSGSGFHAWFGVGVSDDTPSEGYGFVIQAGVLKCYVGFGATQNYEILAGADLANSHVYRAQFVPSENSVYYFIDGTLVVTLEIPTSSPDSDGGPMIGVRASSAMDGNTIVSDLHFSRSLIN